MYICTWGGFVRVHSGQTAFALFHPHLLLLRLLLLYFLILALFIFKNSSFANQQPVCTSLYLSLAFNSIFTMTQHVGIAMRSSRKWVENSYWWLTMVGRKISVTNKSGEMQQPPNCDTDDELWMHSRVVSVEGSVCHCGWEAAMASQQLRSSQPYRSSLQELPAMRTTVPVAHCANCATNLDK